MNRITINKNEGFTLIELITVVAIIALLSAFILTNLASSRNKANDAKTIMQAKTIANALYLSRDANTGAWPAGSGSGWQCLKSGGSCWLGLYSGNPTIVSQLSTYLPNIPTPPNPPFTSSTYLNDAYLYSPSYSGPAGEGAYLVWGQ